MYENFTFLVPIFILIYTYFEDFLLQYVIFAHFLSSPSGTAMVTPLFKILQEKEKMYLK